MFESKADIYKRQYKDKGTDGLVEVICKCANTDFSIHFDYEWCCYVFTCRRCFSSRSILVNSFPDHPEEFLTE